MKKILLSMQPHWKEKIMSGEKILEYRTRFLDEEVIAYLYVSKPVCGIAGILHLGKKIYLEDWLEKYKDDLLIFQRIQDYMQRKNKVAMPVVSFQETETIYRTDLNEKLDKFVVPQSYYYLKEGSALTDFLSEKIILLGERKYNNFSENIDDDVCKNYYL